MVIARLWRGAVDEADAPAYLELMRQIAIPDYRAVAGNLGAWCLHSARGRIVDVAMLTMWENLAAVRAFAGEDVLSAKYYDFDDRYLLWKAPQVVHSDVHAGQIASSLATIMAQ